jgi:hypothetical protein
LEKAGSFDISTSEKFWNSALPMMDEIATTQKWAIYVIDKEGTLFPRNSQNYWFIFFYHFFYFFKFYNISHLFSLL